MHAGDWIVAVDPRYLRPAEVDTLQGDASRAREILGWTPQVTVKALCAEMVAADLAEARRSALLKAHGHETPMPGEGHHG